MSLIGQQVTVIGAGVAGLAVARALALRGCAVTVLEQATALEDVGAGIQISPNGAAVLRALGLDLAGVETQGVVLRRGSGAQVLRMDVAGRGFRLLHRADLIGRLAEGARAAGVDIRFGVVGDGDAGGIVVGADGVKSGVRAALNGRVAPFFTRQVAWRAVVPGDGGPAQAEVFMARGRHLVTYPIRGGTLRNIVAVEERGDWAAEGWSVPDDPANLRAAFSGFGPQVQGWLAHVRETYLWGLFRHPVAARWHDDCRVLVGDAAHPTLPFLAQGANMALEDAWVLAACMAGHETVPAGFAAYQALRMGRVTRIVAAANANARLYHAGGIRRVVLQAGMRMIGPKRALGRFDWLYGCDVTRDDGAGPGVSHPRTPVG